MKRRGFFASIGAGLAAFAGARLVPPSAANVTPPARPADNAGAASEREYTMVVDGLSGTQTIIHLHGETFDARQVRQLIEQINKETRDGGRIVLL